MGNLEDPGRRTVLGTTALVLTGVSLFLAAKEGIQSLSEGQPVVDLDRVPPVLNKQAYERWEIAAREASAVIAFQMKFLSSFSDTELMQVLEKDFPTEFTGLENRLGTVREGLKECAKIATTSTVDWIRKLKVENPDMNLGMIRKAINDEISSLRTGYEKIQKNLIDKGDNSWKTNTHPPQIV